MGFRVQGLAGNANPSEALRPYTLNPEFSIDPQDMAQYLRLRCAADAYPPCRQELGDPQKWANGTPKKKELGGLQGLLAHAGD